MTTLISVHTSSGCVGRCDAKCYNAETTECTCICGGKNHGAGLVRAVENTREMAETWIEHYKANHDHQSVLFKVQAQDDVQLPLFEAVP